MAQVQYERQGKVVLITMEGDTDLNVGMTGEPLQGRLREYQEDDSLWCAVIIGAGERAFSAGGNVKGRAGRIDEGQNPGGRFWESRGNPLLAAGEITKPLIAAVNGHAIGAGLMLALACDIRVASDNATFGLPELKLGFPAGGGAPFRLPRIMALGPAMEMLLTGDRISAEQAYHWGLVNKIVPLPELVDEAMKLAGRVVANPPLAVRAAKELAIKGLEMTYAENLRLQQSLSYICQQTEDAKEGPKAFAEKRLPRFEGH